MAKIYAPQMPLEFDSKYGFKNVSGTQELVKFHLTNLLLTHPGEKISDPAYGVGLRKFLFEPLVGDTIISIENEVTVAIERNLSYLSVKKVTVLDQRIDPTIQSDHTLVIRIQYVISHLNISSVIDVNVSSESFADSYGF